MIMNQKGFTMIEILTAVVIVVVLVVMAVPYYERTVERSRLAEVRTILSRLQAAKLHTMANMGCEVYNTPCQNIVKLKHLNVAFVNAVDSDYTFHTQDFDYSLVPDNLSDANAVCARRRGGDTAGVIFLYAQYNSTDTENATFLCNDTNASQGCDTYGMSSTSFTCTF